MPIRRVKQYSDRGSIKDLNSLTVIEDPLTSSELRLQKLFNYSVSNKDQKLQSSLGIIAVDNMHDKNAMPINVYRIRQVVDDIKSKSGEAIAQLQQQFSECIVSDLNPVQMEISKKAMIKVAAQRKPAIFRRVSKL